MTSSKSQGIIRKGSDEKENSPKHFNFKIICPKMSTFVVLDGKTIGKHMATKLLKNKISQFKSTADSKLVKKKR